MSEKMYICQAVEKELPDLNHDWAVYAGLLHQQAKTFYPELYKIYKQANDELIRKINKNIAKKYYDFFIEKMWLAQVNMSLAILMSFEFIVKLNKES